MSLSCFSNASHLRCIIQPGIIALSEKSKVRLTGMTATRTAGEKLLMFVISKFKNPLWSEYNTLFLNFVIKKKAVLLVDKCATNLKFHRCKHNLSNIKQNTFFNPWTREQLEVLKLITKKQLFVYVSRS